MAYKQKVILISGLACSGKSHLSKELNSRRIVEAENIVNVDPIRQYLYGDREDDLLTPTEHKFKNEWMRYEILRRLISGIPTVVSEAIMLTRTHHQKPFMDMLSKAQNYREAMEEEQGLNSSSIIDFRPILLYANPEAIQTRIKRPERAITHTPIHDMKDMWSAYSQFEFPDETTYNPLYIDTSDESAKASEDRIMEILNFIDSGIIDNSQIEKKKAAEQSFNKMRKQIDNIKHS